MAKPVNRFDNQTLERAKGAKGGMIIWSLASKDKGKMKIQWPGQVTVYFAIKTTRQNLSIVLIVVLIKSTTVYVSTHKHSNIETARNAF